MVLKMDDPLIGQTALRRLRGEIRWEGNLDESRLGRPFRVASAGH